MKEVTVKDFLKVTEGRQYKVTSEDSKGYFTKINGADIPKSFKMDTVEKNFRLWKRAIYFGLW